MSPYNAAPLVDALSDRFYNMEDRDGVQSVMLGSLKCIESDVPGVMDSLTGVDGRMAHSEASWLEENKVAIAESNAELERNGLWCDEYRIL